MRLTDLVLTLPFLAILLTASALLGQGSQWRVSIILACSSGRGLARVVRGIFLSLREKEYVEAAKAAGAGDTRIMFRHILPNTLGPVIVNGTLAVATAILIEAALSFLGFGIKPPTPSLGVLVADAQTNPQQWWLTVFPGLTIVLIVLVRQLRRRRPARRARSDAAETPCLIRSCRSAISRSSSRLTTGSSTRWTASPTTCIPGETLGIVGESGSGKSVSTMSILGLIPQPPGRIASGTAMFKGRDLLKLSKKELRQFRGDEVAMVFQDPMTSLNPVLKIGCQLGEAIKAHYPKEPDDTVKARVIELLRLVGVPNPEPRYDAVSARVLGRHAAARDDRDVDRELPSLLIADEPTTALDVTIQAQVLEVLKTVQAATGAATILITHDLGIVAELCDRVLVMYGGRIVEEGDVHTIFQNPRHPYTIGLMDSLPKLTEDEEWLQPIPGQPPSPHQPAVRLRVPSAVLPLAGPRACREEVPALGTWATRAHHVRVPFRGGADRRDVEVRRDRAAGGARERGRAAGEARGQPIEATRRAGPAPRSCASKSSSSTSRSARADRSARSARSTPSTVSTCRSRPARRSGSSASPAAARRRSRGR